MDESWRIRMGTMPPTPPPSPPPSRCMQTNYPPRRSTGDTTNRRKPISGDDPLNPEDFTDVFGGPPRTILSRQFSTGLLRSSSSSTSKNVFYEEIFWGPDKPVTGRSTGKSLPEFRIPGDHGKRSDHHDQLHKRGSDRSFYSDIFGCDDHERVVRSRSRSKASSSSVLSSEELSPLRSAVPGYIGDDDVSYYASKLRPINVGSRWTSPRRMGHGNYYPKQQHSPPLAVDQPIYSTEKDCFDDLRNYHFGISKRNASPETISIEPISNNSFRVSADDLQLNSPASAVSSVCHSDQEQNTREIEEESLRQEDAMEQDEEGDDAMSSYVIEINSYSREGACESNDMDEAIAWAKEKFQAHCSESMQECEQEKATSDLKMVDAHQHSEGQTESLGSLDDSVDKYAAEDGIMQLESELNTEMQILDEKIRLWSTGKEADIRLLLSSLHHILWPNNGWCPIPLANIIEIPEVRKAYQKARLCLHPDKLQQRGASLPQKYIAEKAFSILQDAWAAFLSQNILR